MFIVTLLFSLVCYADDWRPTSPGYRYGGRNGETFIAPPWAKEYLWSNDRVQFRPTAKEALSSANGDEKWVLTYRENEKALESYKEKYFSQAKDWQTKFQNWSLKQKQFQKDWYEKELKSLENISNPWVIKKVMGLLKKEDAKRTEAIQTILSIVSEKYKNSTSETPRQLITMTKILETEGDINNSIYLDFKARYAFPTTTSVTEERIKEAWRAEQKRMEEFVNTSDFVEIEQSRYPKIVTSPDNCENFQFDLKANGEAVLSNKDSQEILSVPALVSFACREQYAVVVTSEKVSFIKDSKIMQHFSTENKDSQWIKSFSSKEKQGFFVWKKDAQNEIKSYFINIATEKISPTETAYSLPEKYEFFE